MPDHVATLEDYIREIQGIETKKSKRLVFTSLARYVVTRGWRKMFRRFHHWSSWSFLDFLTLVNEDLLRSQFRQHCSALPTSTKNDTLLGGLLLGMHDREPNGKKMRIETAPTRVVIMLGNTPVLSEELPHLLCAFTEVVRKKEKKQLEKKEGLGVYNEDTCLEFQRLLVAALYAYRTALRVFQKAYAELTNAQDNALKMKRKCGNGKGRNLRQKGVNGENKGQGCMGMGPGRSEQKLTMAKMDGADSKPVSATSQSDADNLAELQKKLVERAQLLWQCTFLLWRIAYSQIFVCHLAMLQKGKWLHLPDKNDVEQTANLTLFAAGLAGQHDKVGIVGAGEQDGTVAEREEGDQDTDQEFQYMDEACNNGHSIQSVYLWWTRLQVSGLEALDIMSTFGSKIATPVKLNLLAERHFSICGGQMEPWETVVMNLAAQTAQAPIDAGSSNVSMLQIRKQIRPFDAQATVALLKQKIDEYVLLGKNCHPIFLSFKPPAGLKSELTSYVPNFDHGMHCEAVLASLIKYHRDNVGAEAGILFKKHVKVMSCLHDHNLCVSNGLFST